MNEVPVFLVTGFLESGKTTFIKEIFNDPDFTENEKILIIACESGIEEFEDSFLKEHDVNCVTIEKKEDFNEAFLKQCKVQYKPTKVIVEYNGMWQYDVIEYLTLPEGWEIVQVMTTIDSTTFESYITNMKSLLIEQFKDADMIVFNRCNDKTNKLTCRNSIKAVNTKASLLFELENGQIDDSPIALPYDINADIIEFKDYDYGVWFIDLSENPDKYKGKKVRVKGYAFNHERYPKTVFAFGRDAMTCCADDMQFLGLLCQTKEPYTFKDKEWIEVEGIINTQFIPQQQQLIPFLLVTNVKKISKPEDELVYF